MAVDVKFFGGPLDGQLGIANRSCAPINIRCKAEADRLGMKGLYEYLDKRIGGVHLYKWKPAGSKARPRPNLRVIDGGKR